MIKRKSSSSKVVEQLPTQKEEGTELILKEVNKHFLLVEEDENLTENEAAEAEDSRKSSKDHLKRRVKMKRTNVGGSRRQSQTSADVHPELSMDKSHPEPRRSVLTSFGSRSSRESRGSRRSSELSFSMKEVLELNTMYESGQEKRKRRSRPRKREGGARRSTWEGLQASRRSSISVLTLTVKKTEKRKKRYFSRSDATPQPQSRTAVHYLVSMTHN